MARTKKIQTPLKPKPRAERPRCLHCERTLEPQFLTPILPPKLEDGRRKAERDAWAKANPPRFTGHYGRYKDDRFCGTTCGYNFAVAHTKARK